LGKIIIERVGNHGEYHIEMDFYKNGERAVEIEKEIASAILFSILHRFA